MANRRRDLTGQRFNRLVALAPVGRDKRGQIIWRFQCDCGNTVDRVPGNIIRGQIKSCGCLQRERQHNSERSRALSRNFGKYQRRGYGGTKEEFDALVTSRCHYCGTHPPNDGIHGIDKLDASCGYADGLLVPCCWTCNKMKGSLAYQDFIDQALQIADWRKAYV